MSIDDVKATIRAGNQAVEHGQQTLVQAAAEAAAAQELAQHTIHDSRDGDAQAGLDELAEVAREVTHALRRFAAATEHADTYLATLG